MHEVTNLVSSFPKQQNQENNIKEMGWKLHVKLNMGEGLGKDQ